MPCVAISLHLHTPHHLLTCSTLLGLHHCMCHVTMPFAAVYTALPCPLWLHAPHRHAPRSCVYQVAMPLIATHTTSLCPLQLCIPHYHAPHSCVYHIAMPLAAACTMLPCPSQLHVP